MPVEWRPQCEPHLTHRKHARPQRRQAIRPRARYSCANCSSANPVSRLLSFKRYLGGNPKRRGRPSPRSVNLGLTSTGRPARTVRSNRCAGHGERPVANPFVVATSTTVQPTRSALDAIRHKSQVVDGQHRAIIDPEKWDEVQRILEASSAKGRGTHRKTARLLLAGKLFDETGEKLIPSQSWKMGKRLRYYISHRLVKDRSAIHPDAWRLPAEQLERTINDLIKQRLSQTGMATKLLPDVSAVQVEAINEKLRSSPCRRDCLNSLERADIRRGAVNLQMDRTQISNLLRVEVQQLDPDQMLFEAPFQLRRRGVELKLHFGETPQEADAILVRNIAKAQRWLAMVIDGTSCADIAKAENTPKRRVHDVVGLAILAPDLLDAVAQGRQPTGLTLDYLIKSGMPADWAEQRQTYSEL